MKLFLNCVLENKAVGVMKAGNTFTIEPMINMGLAGDDHWPDDWTAVTVSGLYQEWRIQYKCYGDRTRT